MILSQKYNPNENQELDTKELPGIVSLKKTHVNLKPVASKMNRTCQYEDTGSWYALDFENSS